MKTTCPSFGHDWIWVALDRMAILLSLRRLIKALRYQLTTQLSFDGEIVGDMRLVSGVKP